MNYFLGLLSDHYDSLIVANGDPIPRPLFNDLRARCGRMIALDGGLERLRRWDIPPDEVVGDFDSVAKETLNWARRRHAAIHHRPSPEKSDLHKGIDFCRQRGFKRVLVVNVAGDRMDHLLFTLSSSLLTSSPKADLVNSSMVLLPMIGRVARSLAIPYRHTISWFGFPEAYHCTLDGVKWPFRNRTLRLNGFYSLSNEPSAGIVRLSQRKGRSLLMVSLRPTLQESSKL